MYMQHYYYDYMPLATNTILPRQQQKATIWRIRRNTKFIRLHKQDIRRLIWLATWLLIWMQIFTATPYRTQFTNIVVPNGIRHLSKPKLYDYHKCSLVSILCNLFKSSTKHKIVYAMCITRENRVTRIKEIIARLRTKTEHFARFD